MALLEVRGVSKNFPGVRALTRVDFDVRAGEVHALIGENGAGKSTLIKLIGGVFRPDSGTIRFESNPVSFASPHDARRAGIHALYQEFNLLPEATVTENIFLGTELKRGRLPLLDWPRMHAQTADLLRMLNLSISPDQRVCDLNVAEQQMIELAKALHVQPKLLLMDEPTATLSEREVRTLFDLIARIKQRGIGVIYISHRPAEILKIADRITVLRDGRQVVTVAAPDTSTDQLISSMLGKPLANPFARRASRPGAEVLRVERLTRRPTFEDVSFALYSGEIVGLAGLVGSGRTALVRSIFGLDPPDSGVIYVSGKPAPITSPRDAVALGIGLLPENRQEQALLLDMSARENISLTQLGRSGALISQQAEHRLVRQYIDTLRIKVSSPEAKTRYLSGGTQQKIILSRWLAVHPRILIFDEPTQNIDIGTKIEIYRLLGELASQGSAILMISSELAEIVGLCDRALVMRSGQLVKTLEHDRMSEEALLGYAMGEAR
ncbi:MAG TPA: sugar ABC transporter ATP-binding protein [Phototrophicaceae bacterium]|nr:sugar ABC transporter ATP-binding protein [Phototrophicaceae bacterium]